MEIGYFYINFLLAIPPAGIYEGIIKRIQKGILFFSVFLLWLILLKTYITYSLSVYRFQFNGVE